MYELIEWILKTLAPVASSTGTNVDDGGDVGSRLPIGG